MAQAFSQMACNRTSSTLIFTASGSVGSATRAGHDSCFESNMRTRRNFLLNCSAVAVTASVAPVSVFASPRRLAEVPLEQISLAAFLSHANSTFQAQLDSGPAVGLQLVEIVSTPAVPAQFSNSLDGANEKFSLLFSGPLNHPLEQNTYSFECQGIGRFEMFIVPIGSTETTHLYYEAIFNRPVGGVFPQAEPAGAPHARTEQKIRRPTN